MSSGVSVETDNESQVRKNDALAVLASQIQTHESYHTQKENITWLVVAAYLSATMLLVGREPFWKCWQVPWFSAWLCLLLVTAVAILMFLNSQFLARHITSAFFLAANDVATQWITKQPEAADLEPRGIRELDGMLVFAAVEKRFGEILHGGPSIAQRVALLLVVAWSLASVMYLLASYSSFQPLCSS